MDDLKVNFYSVRSEKARIGATFNEYVVLLLNFATVVLVVSGVVLFTFGFAIGWLLVGLSVIPAMAVEWNKGELINLPTVKRSNMIDDVLSGEILGKLSKKPTPQDLASIVCNTQGGQFFMARFGISANFLQTLASDKTIDLKSVFEMAVKIQKQTGSAEISAVVLLVALIKSSSASNNLLNHLQLDYDDLINGINWYNHLQNSLTDIKKPRFTGGIARDWSFGYTPLLNHFCKNISLNSGGLLTLSLESHDEAVKNLINIFSKKGRQNAVLIGQSGVGKTRIVQSFASKIIDASSKIPANLKFQQVFMLDATSLISAAPKRGEIENLMTQILNEAYKSKNTILFLDNAHLFFEDGAGTIFKK